jgi:hypothetical protein
MNGEEEKKENVCALEHNIKSKGEYSYYYAHGRKFEKKDEEQGKVISGPGIITGGDPILLDKSIKEVVVLKDPVKFTKYIFYDDDKNVKIKIDLPDTIVSSVSDECLVPEFDERSINLRVLPPNSDSYIFHVKKLFQKIVPKDSSAKLFKGKIIITLRKQNDEEEWEKLNA